MWTPHHELNDRKIDQFLVVSRSVGTFARALDCSSSVKQPSLHMSAAAASRDITLVSDSKTHIEKLSLKYNIFYFSSMRWILSTSTVIQSNQQCAPWCRRVVQCCVAMKWKSGVHQKRICSKKHLTNTAKTSTTSEMILWVKHWVPIEAHFWSI